MLNINNVSFSYGSSTILKDVSMSLKTGEIGTLIGASGSGKSTLFKLLAGLLSPQTGVLSIGGKPQPESYAYVTYMMQEDLLLPWRNVYRNVSLMAELGKTPLNKHSLHSNVLSLLAETEMSGYEEFFPDQLSGGMRQRVALARALMQKRPLLLLDEPFGALDAILREQMYKLLRKIQSKHSTTMLMVTHDFRDALALPLSPWANRPRVDRPHVDPARS